jgi:hypothetical protein
MLQWGGSSEDKISKGTSRGPRNFYEARNATRWLFRVVDDGTQGMFLSTKRRRADLPLYRSIARSKLVSISSPSGLRISAFAGPERIAVP